VKDLGMASFIFGGGGHRSRPRGGLQRPGLRGSLSLNVLELLV
jgi:hypothetical protein